MRVSTGGRDDGGRDVRTSPSHLFLPLRQLVHARAPRFGMCDGGTFAGRPCPPDGSCGEDISDRPPLPFALVVKLSQEIHNKFLR